MAISMLQNEDPEQNWGVPGLAALAVWQKPPAAAPAVSESERWCKYLYLNYGL